MAIVIGVLLLAVVQNGAAYWWALGTGSLNIAIPKDVQSTSMPSICKQLTSINERQKKLCQEFPDLMPSVAVGARISIDQCQQQFRTSRWNCPINDGTSVFGKILEKGTRESAFIHAITAAGLVTAITEACAGGKSTNCDCDNGFKRKPLEATWKWGGCSRDIGFGLRYSERFVDATEVGKKKSARRDMNKHNNRAGREAITEGLYRKCKCHGVSGSCDLKTCWINLPKFSKVGAKLKEKYDSAHEMRVVRKKRNGKERYRKLKPKKKEYAWPTTHDLIYYEKSPSFCRQNANIGSLGTRGRECNITSSGADGCELMCCHRGYDFNAVPETKSCKCKFVWCCSVKCEKCTEIRKVYTCR